METIEIIVFFTIAIIIGGMVVAFIAGISPDEIFKTLKKAAFPEEEIKYEKIMSKDLALKAYNVWKKCGFGERNISLTLYVESGQQINKSMLFKTYKKLNFCHSIQSVNQSCGGREDTIIINEFIETPALVKISCDATNKTLFIN